MKGSSTGTASWISRRKIYIIVGLVLFACLFVFIKEKYFYRSDLLKPIQINTEKGLTKFKVRLEKNQGGVLGYILGFGSSKKENELAELNIWDKWIIDHPDLKSIGDIYDKCDNSTRTKIGKVVLEDNKKKGLSITSYCNQTYEYTVTHATSHMSVFYKGSLLYEKDYNMCETAPLMDTPYHCPIVKGQTINIRDVANMPSYIPKGRYKVTAYVKDQDGNDIGCTYIEFKTGEQTAS